MNNPGIDERHILLHRVYKAHQLARRLLCVSPLLEENLQVSWTPLSGSEVFCCCEGGHVMKGKNYATMVCLCVNTATTIGL